MSGVAREPVNDAQAILAYLERAGDGASPSEIGRDLRLDPDVVRCALAALEQIGLVQRVAGSVRWRAGGLQ